MEPIPAFGAAARQFDWYVPQTRHSNDESARAKCIARASHKNARDPLGIGPIFQLMTSCQLATLYRQTRARLLDTVKLGA